MKFAPKTLLLGLMAAATVAHAGGSARVVCNRFTPSLEVSYSTGADAGKPGLLWVGVLTQDQSGGAFHTGKDWESYNGGLYPFHSRYDGGLPATIRVTLPFPGNSSTTAQYVGYTVYTGNAQYTPEMREQVRDRREALNLVKNDMIARGVWRSEFDSDDYPILALAQNDLMRNKKYGMVLTIPFVDCNPAANEGGL